jgi:hypothetical protein
MNKSFEDEKDMLISYLTLRKVIGILGATLPFTAALGAFLVFQNGIQSSLSSYYHTGMRDVFVGTLWAIGIFLYAYKGFERADNIAGNLGCIFAIGITLFPTTPDKGATDFDKTIGTVHFIFAALFFLTLIYFSLFLFTKTKNKTTMTQQKRQRNMVYKVCGYTMAACILLIAILALIPASSKTFIDGIKPVFWLETIAIIAFGVSWLVKGEAILKDK